MRLRKKSLATFAAATFALSGILSACSNSDDEALTLYNAQHEDLMQLMVDGFTDETGIKVNMRNGGDFELANHIVQEGNASPADVFATENSPAMSLVGSSGGFSTIGADTVAQVPSQYRPSDNSWTGFAARSTVFPYNKSLLPTAELPASILDLADPKWKDQIGISPAGADFQAIVSAVLALKGEQATADWLAGLKANAKVYQGNIAVMKAVNGGEIRGGVIYHYYWHKDRAESGANSSNTDLHYFGNQDPGAFVSVSGLGVVKSSRKQEQAAQFVKFVTSPAGQKILAESKALEYPVGNNAAANPALKPLADLNAPTVDAAGLNGPKVTELMQKAGLL